MLRDITLGQYMPGDTVIHRLDPRTKIILTIFYIAIIFCVASPIWYVIPLVYLLAVSKLSGLTPKRLLKSVKPLRFLLILTFVLNLFFSSGTTVGAFQHEADFPGGGHVHPHAYHLARGPERRH